MDDETPGDAIGYEPALAAASPALERHRCEPDAACLQPYTSGSTGKPKGVLLTHAGQVWNSDVMRRAFAIDQHERGLVAVPLYHKNAMIGTVKPFLLAGGSFVVRNGFDAVRVIEAIERHQMTYMTGVPAMLKMVLAAHDALDRHDVSTIRYVVCGSAEVPDELFAEFERVFGAPMAESYGLTEGGPVPLVNRRGAALKRGSSGQAFDGCDVRLVAEDGVTDVGVDEPGELVTRNPGLAAGYYFSLGRRDEMISVAGENVYPKEVEDLLLRHPGCATRVSCHDRTR